MSGEPPLEVDGLPEDTQKRLPFIMKGLRENKSYEEISAEMDPPVSSLVIARDMALWMESPGYDAWLDSEFFRLHPLIASGDPAKAYEKIVQLKKARAGKKIDENGKERPDVAAGEEISRILDELTDLGVFRGEAERTLQKIGA